ncbi:hypothetical protein KSC_036140 [Ktedonobacter sp. SOSP1-52]|nr:hypothetical protein KSC_036140 [Ktedonobacter sp. SOSP1-52]
MEGMVAGIEGMAIPDPSSSIPDPSSITPSTTITIITIPTTGSVRPHAA